jgi:hypothetical protein
MLTSLECFSGKIKIPGVVDSLSVLLDSISNNIAYLILNWNDASSDCYNVNIVGIAKDNNHNQIGPFGTDTIVENNSLYFIVNGASDSIDIIVDILAVNMATATSQTTAKLIESGICSIEGHSYPYSKHLVIVR